MRPGCNGLAARLVVFSVISFGSRARLQGNRSGRRPPPHPARRATPSSHHKRVGVETHEKKSKLRFTTRQPTAAEPGGFASIPQKWLAKLPCKSKHVKISTEDRRASYTVCSRSLPQGSSKALRPSQGSSNRHQPERSI